MDLNFNIQFSTVEFDTIFNGTKPSINKSLLTLIALIPQSIELEISLINCRTKNIKTTLAYFLTIENTLSCKILEFRPILNPTSNDIAAILLSISEHKEYGLFLHSLKQNNLTRNKISFSNSTNNKLIKMLTDFQLTICYLVIQNCSNERIADVINGLDHLRVKKTTRNSINKQIEVIRDIFSMPSKEALVEHLNFLNLNNFLPPSIFKDRLLLLDSAA